VRCPGFLPKAFFNKSKTYIMINHIKKQKPDDKEINMLNGTNTFCRLPWNNVNLEIL
jgi:hypothetical protein